MLLPRTRAVKPATVKLMPAMMRSGTSRGLASAASPPVVKLERGADGIAQVILSRPEKMNALSMDMFRSLRDAARALIADSSGVKAVVISGEGRAFCAGLDLKSLMSKYAYWGSNSGLALFHCAY